MKEKKKLGKIRENWEIWTAIAIVVIIVIMAIFAVRIYQTEESIPIELQDIENKLNSGKKVTNEQFYRWASSSIASKEEIKKYGKDMVLVIFLTAMENQDYNKANKLYQPLLGLEVTIEQLKQYNWSNWKITDATDDGSFVTLKLGGKTLYVSIGEKEISSITIAVQ